jgi:hypothetical protein
MSLKICKGTLCNGKELPLEDFSPSLKICKKCNCHNIKEYYKKNNRPYRKFKNDIKEKSECVKCGCNDISLLEFDHIDKKNITISKNFSKKTIENELQYVQILCIWCHRLKTRDQMDELKEVNNQKYNIISRPTNEKEGNICNGPLCEGKLQFLDKFYNSRKICIQCNSYVSRSKREANLEFLNQMKLNKKECELCKIQVTKETTCCFDYDHLGDKNANLSVIVRLNKDTRQQMIDESKKCRLLCCKCHKIVTTTDYNFNYEGSTCVVTS